MLTEKQYGITITSAIFCPSSKKWYSSERSRSYKKLGKASCAFVNDFITMAENSPFKHRAQVTVRDSKGKKIISKKIV